MRSRFSWVGDNDKETTIGIETDSCFEGTYRACHNVRPRIVVLQHLLVANACAFTRKDANRRSLHWSPVSRKKECQWRSIDVPCWCEDK